jgi:hypothetical protein
VLERAELAIGLRGSGELGLEEVGPLASEPMQLEHEATDVAELELAQLAQVPGATPHPRALPQSAPAGLQLRRRGAVRPWLRVGFGARVESAVRRRRAKTPARGRASALDDPI